MLFSRNSLFILSLAGLLVSCGGGGGGSSSGGGSGQNPEPSPSPSAVPSPTPTVPPSERPGQDPLPLQLGTPSANPLVIPPSTEGSTVKFISVISGDDYPAELKLDEVDANGTVIQQDVATLLDNGANGDLHRGDRTFSALLNIANVESSARFYRVRAANEGEEVLSTEGSLWVSGCPARARPSNPNHVVFDASSGAYIFSNEVMITVGDGVAPNLDLINELSESASGRVVGCIPSLNQYLLEIEGDDTAQGVYDAIAALVSQNEIVQASPNVRVIDLPQSFAPECSGDSCQWYLDRIRAPQAWAVAGGGDEQLGVAVIDFGVDCTHSELNCDENVFNEDAIDHGTGVASLISARNDDGSALAGVAWNSALYPYSFLGRGGSQYKLSELITSSLSEDNVKVINISAATAIDPDNLIRDAICSAIGSGRLVVTAAGNAAANNSCAINNIYPAQYNSIGSCANGADLQGGLLVVGASDFNNDLAYWDGDQQCSNIQYADIYAPGKDIYTASSDSTYALKAGTSFATPLVSGGAAVVWSTSPELNPSSLHERLINSAVRLSQSASDTRTSTSSSELEGQPLLDVYAAVVGSVSEDITDFTPEIEEPPRRTESAKNTLVSSEPIVVEGLDLAAPIDIEGGYYSIDGGPFTDAAGVIENGQTIVVQVLSDSQPETESVATVNVGDGSFNYSVMTEPANNSALDFDFVDQSQVPMGSAVISNSLIISDLTSDTPISISNGFYSIDGGPFINSDGVVGPTQSIRLQVQAANEPEAITTATVTIGGVSDDFTVTTEDADISPAPFAFDTEMDVPLSEVRESNSVPVTDINTPVVISVSGGEYSIDGGVYTNQAGEIEAGQTVRVRQTSAAIPESDSFTTLTVGTFSATYRLTTISVDTAPDAFTLTDVTEVETSSVVSASMTVSGITAAVPVQISGGQYSINGDGFTSADGIVVNGDQIQVQLQASSEVATTVEATLTVGNVSDVFSVSTVGASLPDAFDFADESDVLRAVWVPSNSETITGLNSTASLTISGGEYSINGGTFTNVAGTINNNDTLQLRVLSASEFSSTNTATVTIAGISDTYGVTTEAADTVVDPFTFTDEPSAELNEEVISNVINVSGINTAVSVNITNGEYRINGGSFVSGLSSVVEGDQVEVRLTASGNVASTMQATLSIGAVSDTFSVTTIGASLPDVFDFADLTGVQRGVWVESQEEVISGLNSATPISISGGEYSIDGGAYLSAPSTIGDGQSVRVRVFSSGAFSSISSATLDIAGVTDTFNVTTELEDVTPSVFSFPAVLDAQLNTLISSEVITVEEINSSAPISIVGGEYSVNGAAFTNVDSTVSLNDEVQVRVLSSVAPGNLSIATLTIGSVSSDFNVTAEGSDTTPDAFLFLDQTEIEPSELRTSNTITISGINTAASISINNGQYQINGGAYTSAAGSVVNGDQVAIQLTASAAVSTTVEATLSIGSVSDTFSVSTVGATLPNTFTIPDEIDAPISTQVSSDVVPITGLNSAVAISVTNGEYRIDGGTYTTAPGTINNNQTVQLRVTSSANFSDTVNAELNISGISDTYSVTTLAEDTVPATFTISNETNAALSTEYTSAAVTISGINSASPVSISGGEYSINSGAFTAAPGTITNAQNVRVRLTSASEPETVSQATLTVGGVSEIYAVTTLDADIAPDAFLFDDQSDIDPGDVRTSNAVTISGINTATPISISNGQYRVNGGSYTSASSSVVNGDQITIQLQASSSVSTTVEATLTVGTVSDTFSVSTVGATLPDAFAFTDETDVPLSTQITSTAVTISGLNSAVPISIIGGEYSIDGGAFTAVSGTINNDQSVQVRAISSSNFSETVDAVLNVSGVTDTFRVTTLAEDTVPAVFTIPDQNDAQLNTLYISDAVTINDINSPAAVSIIGGEYSISGGVFTSSAGVVTNGQSIRVRFTSAAEPEIVSQATLTVGGVSETYIVATLAADTTPDAFFFNDQSNIQLSEVRASNTVTIGGINTATAISINNGQYQINSEPYTNVAGTVVNGDQVTIQLAASDQVSTTVEATLSVGSVSDTFSVSTVGATLPDAFTIPDEIDMPLSIEVSSDVVPITGLNSAVAISVANGEYRIDGGTYTTAPGTINNNQTVQMRVTSSANFSDTVNAELNISGISDTFSVTTLAEDTVPATFPIADETNAQLNTQYTSTAVTISGINSASPVSISGGEYSINSGAFTAAPGTITSGQNIRVRLTSAATPDTTVQATLTIGGVTENYSVTTVQADTTPDAFPIASQTGVNISEQRISDPIIVSGVNTSTSISVANGEYSIGAAPFSNVSATVENGESVRVRLTASDQFDTAANATLTIGGVSEVFSVTTLAADTTPAAFDLGAGNNIELSTFAESSVITVADINTATPISINNGGQYRINGGAYTAAAGTVSLNDQVQVRLLSSGSYNATLQTTLTIGGVIDIFEVTTEENSIPVFTSGTSVSVQEDNDAIGYTATATDGNGDTLTYSISGGADQNLFSINAGSGVLTFNTAPDFESPADSNGDNIYVVILSVSDGLGGSASQTVNVTVTNQNETPTFTSSAGVNVEEGNTVTGYTAAATDPDGDTLTYSISAGADQNLFSINASSGVLTFNTAPDFESPADSNGDNVYVVELLASDGNGGSVTRTVSVTVTNQNETPMFASGASISVDEGNTVTGYTAVATDPDGDALTYSVSGGADQSMFAINSASGSLSFNSAPNYSSPSDSNGDNIYEVVLSASDGLLQHSQAVSVEVLFNDIVAPTAEIAFPPAISLTFESSIEVRGVASDSSGIASVVVNGVLATTIDGFASWQASINLAEGENVIQAIVTDEFSNIREVNIDIARISDIDPTFGVIEYDESSRTIYVEEGDRILAIDRDTHIPRVFSGNGIPDNLNTFSYIADMKLDSANQRLLVSDAQNCINPFTYSCGIGGQETIKSVSLADGSRSVLFQDSQIMPTVSYLSGLSHGIQHPSNSDLIIVANNTTINAVNITNNTNSIISNSFTGAGPVFESLNGLSVHPTDSNLLLITDTVLDALLSVNISTGERIIISDAVTGGGTAFAHPSAVIPHPQNTSEVLVADGSRRYIFAVDLVSGNRLEVLELGSSSATYAKAYTMTPHPTNLNQIYVNDRGLYLELATLNPESWEIISQHAHSGNSNVGDGPDVDNGYIISHPQDNNLMLMVISETGGNGVLEVNLTNGDRSMLTGLGVGSGVDLNYTNDLIPHPTDSNELIVVSDFQIYSVNLTTGYRTVIADNSNLDDVSIIGGIDSFDFDEEQNSLVIAATNPNILMEHSLDDGNRRVLYGDGRSIENVIVDRSLGRYVFDAWDDLIALDFNLLGSDLLYPDSFSDIALHPNGQDYLGANSFSLSSVDRISGSVSTIANSLSSAYEMAVNSANNEAIFAGSDEMSVVDLDTGAITDFRLNVLPFEDSDSLLNPQRMFYAQDGYIYLIDSGRSIFRVDPNGGEKTLVVDDDPIFSSLWGVTSNPADSSYLLVIDNSRDALFSVNIASGQIAVVSDAGESVGAGPAFSAPRDVAAYPNDSSRVLVVDPGMDALVSVDLATGDRSIISDSSIGSGEVFTAPLGVIPHPSDIDRVLVVDSGNDALFSVSLTDGGRTIISDPTIGLGEFLSTPYDIAVHPTDDNLVLVADYGLNSVVEINLTTGDRRIMSGGASGVGPGLTRIKTIVSNPDTGEVWAANDAAYLSSHFPVYESVMSIDVETGNRVIISR